MSAVRVWVCGERYVIGKSCKKVKESFKNEKKFQKSEKKGKCCKKYKREKKGKKVKNLRRRVVEEGQWQVG